MITRLKVKGFKNLYDVELYFGPFTCVAGTNGVGKSNLFDALKFLGELANKSLVEASLSIRETETEKRSKSLDIRNIFFNDGKKYCDKIEFEVDLILPTSATDDLGQTAKPTTAFVTYKLGIKYNEDNTPNSKNILEIIYEKLLPLKKTEFQRTLTQMGASGDWIKSVTGGKRQNATPFIDTNETQHTVIISQDQVQGGRKKNLMIKTLPRTILSTANAIEMPTALICKREMESWRFLQLEPSALRSADDVSESNQRIQANGSHLPATLYRLINNNANVSLSIANRLTDLIDDIFEINVDKDEKRDILTLMLKGKDGNFLPASSLSDGTLRFLALSIIEADPSEQGLICLEEPENGIHPARIPAILQLLKDIAADVSRPFSDDNPLRQVIINTHSPLVVSEIDDDVLLVAEPITYKENNRRFEGVIFKPLSDTWRINNELPSSSAISKATLLKYLNPLSISQSLDDGYELDIEKYPMRKRKVKERPEVGQLSIHFSSHDY